MSERSNNNNNSDENAAPTTAGGGKGLDILNNTNTTTGTSQSRNGSITSSTATATPDGGSPGPASDNGDADSSTSETKGEENATETDEATEETKQQPGRIVSSEWSKTWAYKENPRMLRLGEKQREILEILFRSYPQDVALLLLFVKKNVQAWRMDNLFARNAWGKKEDLSSTDLLPILGLVPKYLRIKDKEMEDDQQRIMPNLHGSAENIVDAVCESVKYQWPDVFAIFLRNVKVHNGNFMDFWDAEVQADTTEWPLVHMACAFGEPIVLRLVLEELEKKRGKGNMKAEVNTPLANHSAMLPMVFAAIARSYACAQLLLDSGARLGSNADAELIILVEGSLWHAAACTNTKLVKILLQFGATVSDPTNVARVGRYTAERLRYDDALKILHQELGSSIFFDPAVEGAQDPKDSLLVRASHIPELLNYLFTKTDYLHAVQPSQAAWDLALATSLEDWDEDRGLCALALILVHGLPTLAQVDWPRSYWVVACKKKKEDRLGLLLEHFQQGPLGEAMSVGVQHWDEETRVFYSHWASSNSVSHLVCVLEKKRHFTIIVVGLASILLALVWASTSWGTFDHLLLILAAYAMGVGHGRQTPPLDTTGEVPPDDGGSAALDHAPVAGGASGSTQQPPTAAAPPSPTPSSTASPDSRMAEEDEQEGGGDGN